VKKSEAARVTAMIQGAWSRPPLPESTVEVYEMALVDLDYELVKDAVMRLVQTSKWLPTIAEIREHAVKGRVALPSPEEAHGIVRRAVGQHGSYRTPTFDCDEIDGAVQDVGWRALCMAQEGDAANRSRFCSAYKARVDRRLELEATGRYRPQQKALPPAWRDESERPPGDTRVLVQTGYATDETRKRLGPGEVAEEPKRLGLFAELLEGITEIRPDDEEFPS
jgi:hypothetical protein